MTHCLLFDSDGTLVDSEAINTEALADELRLHGINEDKDKLLERYRGWQFKALLADLGQLHHQLQQNHTAVQFELCFRKRASEYFAERLEPIANIHEALQQLKHDKCVASNAPMSKLQQVLAKTKLDDFFGDRLFSAYDISCFKPDPGLFLHAAEQMAYAPASCIVIEDSEVGVQAAIKAGMKCIHYLPYCATGEFAGSQKLLAITEMLELPAAISTLERLN